MVLPTNFEDPRRTIRTLFSDQWDETNTPSVGTPGFATEWVDRVDSARPLVTVTDPNDSPTAAAGYSSIRGDGSGASARKRGFVVVNCWADDREPGEIGTNDNPKVQAREMWNECERIVLAHTTGTGDLEMLRTDGPLESRTETETGVIHRLHGRVDYEYELTPV